MTDDDATRDGLPRFIYGEYTGEIQLPPRPEEEDAPAGPMDRKTKVLIASGGLALVLIVGLVVAALLTGGPDVTPAAANPESPAASAAPTTVPAPSDAAEPTQSWPMLTGTDIPGGQATTAKPQNTRTTATTTTTKPVTQTTKPESKPTTHKPPRPSHQ
jgi:hypothetical protein